MRNCLVVGFALVLGLLLAVSNRPAYAEQRQRFHFDIPQQRADAALTAAAQQADVTILFQYDEAKKHYANRLVGEYTLMKAMQILLSGSGLKAAFDERGHLIISTDARQSENKMKNNQKRVSGLAGLVSFLTSIMAPQASMAQTQNVSALEEVVVTANKRGAMSIQDIAGSIQAIGSKTLERSQVGGFEDYIKLVPGLTSVSSGTGQSQIVIRGVNSSRVTHQDPQTRALAGLYMDEMPISVTGFNPDLGVVDIERIEVLKGPQGTLYGASSMSGTVRIITKKPSTDELSGKVSADYSWTKSGDPSHGYSASLNLPVSDSVAMSVSAYGSEKGGFIDNVAPANQKDNYNKEDVFGGRIQLAYYGDKLDVTSAIIYNKLDAEGRPDEYFVGDPSPVLAPITDELQTVKFVDDSFVSEFTGFNLTLDYDFENVNFVSATSVFDVEVSNRLDDTLRIGAVLGIPLVSDFRNETENTSFIQELRLTSTYESPLEWIVGLYYEANRKDFDQTQPTPGLNALFTARGVPPCGTLTGPCFGAVNDSVFDGEQSLDTDQLALFGEATYSLTEALRLKLGLRWFDYESDVDLFSAGPATGGPLNNVETVEEDGVVPKVEVSYDVSDDHMVYASYSEGFRLGGVNSNVPTACDAQLAALGTASGASYDSDNLTNIEVGAKTSWLDNRLVVNAAVYRNVFEDIQTAINLSSCGFFQQFNAGELENTGLDADFAFQATESLSLTLGVSYIDSEVTKAVSGLNSKGDEAPYVSKFTASGSIEYSTPMRKGSGYIRTNLRYVGSSSNEFTSRPTAVEIDSYTIIDLTLGYEQEDWELSLFAQNLFDEEVITNIDPDRLQPSQATRGRPRTVGVKASYRF